jgi:hypothetical protein
VSPEQSGVYKCIAENSFGNESITFRVSIKAPLAVSYLSFADGKGSNLDEIVEPKQSFELHCKVEGSPEPSIKWIHVSSLILLRF